MRLRLRVRGVPHDPRAKNFVTLDRITGDCGPDSDIISFLSLPEALYFLLGAKPPARLIMYQTLRRPSDDTIITDGYLFVTKDSAGQFGVGCQVAGVLGWPRENFENFELASNWRDFLPLDLDEVWQGEAVNTTLNLKVNKNHGYGLQDQRKSFGATGKFE